MNKRVALFVTLFSTMLILTVHVNGGKPLTDPIVDNGLITAQWQPLSIQEMTGVHPTGQGNVTSWRDSYLQNSVFQNLPVRPFAIDTVRRYFLIYDVKPEDSTVDDIVRRYASEMRCDDPNVLLTQFDFPGDKATILAQAIHQAEYNRSSLQEGDRVLLIAPVVRVLIMDGSP